MNVKKPWRFKLANSATIYTKKRDSAKILMMQENVTTIQYDAITPPKLRHISVWCSASRKENP